MAIDASDSLRPSISLMTLRRVHQLANAFEVAWRNGERPRIELLLAEANEQERAALLEYLLVVEREVRAERGEAVELDEYLRRFPNFTCQVQHAFQANCNGCDTDTQCRSTESGVGEAPWLPRAWEDYQFEKFPCRFGNYELLEELGHGGMGRVFRALQTAPIRRDVALKMIHPHLLDQRHIERFHQEAELAARLDHPHIVPIHEVGEHAGRHYFAMGYVAGESLANKLAGGPLSPRQAATLVRKVAEAMEHAHVQGIVHRDLKPSNILLDAHDEPRVADFGLAKRLTDDRGLTQSRQIVGTAGYMSPEQARGESKQVEPLADVYGLGAVLYCALTGRPPFQSASDAETLKQVLQWEPVAPRALNPAVPRDLETICLKCLAKEPRRRYQSARELAEDVARFLDDRPIFARPISKPARVGRWCRRNPLPTMLLAACLAAVALLGSNLHFASQSRVRQELADTQRYYALLREAERWALEAEPGWTYKAEYHLREASRIRPAELPATELRSLAARVFSAVDVREAGTVEFDWDVANVAYSPDGKLLAVAELKGDPFCRLVVLNAATRKQVGFYHVPTAEENQRRRDAGEAVRWQDGFRELAFSPNGHWLAAGARHGQIHCFDLRSAGPEPTKSWQAHAKEVTCVAFGHDGQRLYSCNREETLKCWDASRGFLETTGEGAPQAESFELSPDGKLLHTFHFHSHTHSHVMDARTFEPHATCPDVPPFEASFARANPILAIQGNPKIRLLELRHGTQLRDFDDREASGVAFGRRLKHCANDRLLVGGDEDGRLRIWDALSGQVLSWAEVPGVSRPRFSVSHDGRRLATFKGTSLQVHDIRLPAAWGTTASSTTKIDDIDLSADGRTLITGRMTTRLGQLAECQVSRWDLPSDIETRRWSLRCLPQLTKLVGANKGAEAFPYNGGLDGAEPTEAYINVALSPNGHNWAAATPAFEPLRFGSGVKTGGLHRLAAPRQVPWQEFEAETLAREDGKTLSIVDDPHAQNGRAVRLAAGEEWVLPVPGDMTAKAEAFAIYAVMRADAKSIPAKLEIGAYYHRDRDVPSRVSLDGRPGEYEFHLIDVSHEGVFKKPGKYRAFLRAAANSGPILIDRLLIAPLHRLKSYWMLARPFGPLRYARGELLWGIMDEERVLAWKMPAGQLVHEYDNTPEREKSGDHILTNLDATDAKALVGTRKGDVICLVPSERTLTKEVWPVGRERICALRIAPRGDVVAIADVRGKLQLRSMNDGQVVQELLSRGKAVRAVEFSADGRLLATGAEGGALQFWQATTKGFTQILSLDLPGAIQRLRFTADGRHLLVLIHKEHAVRVLDLVQLNRQLGSLHVSLAMSP